MDARKRYDYIFNGPGKRTLSTASSSCSLSAPEWFDRALMNRAQKLYSIYSFVLSKASAYGLIYGLTYPEAYIPLASTGHSSSISHLFDRYLSTALHLKSWYESDPFDPSSLAHKSIRKVRNYHRQVSNKFNENIDPKQFIDGVWLSQADFCLTQWAFIGFFIVFPQHFGAQTWTREDFVALSHFWRIIGYCLGMNDEYNLCTNNFEQTYQLCSVIFYENSFKFLNPQIDDGLKMGDAIISISGIPANVFRKYSENFFDNKTLPNKVELNSCYEKVHYFVHDLTLHRLSTSVTFMWILSQLYHLFLWFSNLNATKLKKSLEAKHAKDQFNFGAYKKCPFRTKIAYKSFQKTFL